MVANDGLLLNRYHKLSHNFLVLYSFDFISFKTYCQVKHVVYITHNHIYLWSWWSEEMPWWWEAFDVVNIDFRVVLAIWRHAVCNWIKYWVMTSRVTPLYGSFWLLETMWCWFSDLCFHKSQMLFSIMFKVFKFALVGRAKRKHFL